MTSGRQLTVIEVSEVRWEVGACGCGKVVVSLGVVVVGGVVVVVVVVVEDVEEEEVESVVVGTLASGVVSGVVGGAETEKTKWREG